MTGQRWQPGDAATYAGEVLFYADSGKWIWAQTGLPCMSQAAVMRHAHRLVVIDPVAITGPDETGDDGDPNHEIANCLRRLAESDHPRSYRRRVAERLAEVFAPKPAEPAGLGAVVEDDRGIPWVRASLTSTTKHWRSATDTGHGRRKYADIDVVRILSEGVTA